MIAIVGGGLAAAKLAESYRAAGGSDPVVVYAAEDTPPYSRPPLSKRLLRGESQPKDAYVHPPEWYREHRVDLRLGTRVESLDELDAERVVLATGSRPRTLDGALALRRIEDSLAIRERAREAKTATVIGGGFIGTEVAASLRQLGVEVTLVVRDRILFPSLQAPPLSDALLDRFREHGVDVIDGDPPAADLVVAGIGVEPNTELAERAGLEVDNGVVVSERFESSRPGVYAVGDVAKFFDPLYGRHRRIEHWSTAAYHGTQLGKILAGDAEARYDQVSSFFSEQFGKTFKMFGEPEGHDDLRVEGDFREAAIGRYVAGGHVVAAVLTGQDEDTENALKDEIRAGAAAASAR